MKSFQFYFLLKSIKNKNEVIQLLREYKELKSLETLGKNDKIPSLFDDMLLLYHKSERKKTHL